MKRISTVTRTIGAALMIAITVPLIGLPGWCGPPSNGPNNNGTPGNGSSSNPATRNTNFTGANIGNTVPPGASLGGPVLGGPGSNEQLTPPKLGDPLENVTGPINAGTGALDQSITEGNSIQLDGRPVSTKNILLDQNGQIIDGTSKDGLILNPFGVKGDPIDDVNPSTGLTPQEEAAESLAQPDPAAEKTPQEEAADALGGGSEPGAGSGSGSGSGSGTGTASGGSGSIFQDPTKSGPTGGGIQQAVEAAADRVNNSNINVNEEVVGNPAGNLGNRLQGVDSSPTELAPINALRNTNAASFGEFHEGVSPFSAATNAALPGVGEATNTGVVRSLSAPAGTKGGAVGGNLPVEEVGGIPGAGRAGKASVNNANLSELEAEGGSHLNPNLGKVRVNSGAVPEILNETPIRVPRR